MIESRTIHVVIESRKEEQQALRAVRRLGYEAVREPGGLWSVVDRHRRLLLAHGLNARALLAWCSH